MKIEIKAQIENYIQHCIENSRPKYRAVAEKFDQFDILDSVKGTTVYNGGEFHPVTDKREVKNFAGTSLLIDGNWLYLFIDGKRHSSNA